MTRLPPPWQKELGALDRKRKAERKALRASIVPPRIDAQGDRDLPASLHRRCGCGKIFETRRASDTKCPACLAPKP